jgi:hypothetical protein
VVFTAILDFTPSVATARVAAALGDVASSFDTTASPLSATETKVTAIPRIVDDFGSTVIETARHRLARIGGVTEAAYHATIIAVRAAVGSPLAKGDSAAVTAAGLSRPCAWATFHHNAGWRFVCGGVRLEGADVDVVRSAAAQAAWDGVEHVSVVIV